MDDIGGADGKERRLWKLRSVRVRKTRPIKILRRLIGVNLIDNGVEVNLNSGVNGLLLPANTLAREESSLCGTYSGRKTSRTRACALNHNWRRMWMRADSLM